MKNWLLPHVNNQQFFTLFSSIFLRFNGENTSEWLISIVIRNWSSVSNLIVIAHKPRSLIGNDSSDCLYGIYWLIECINSSILIFNLIDFENEAHRIVCANCGMWARSQYWINIQFYWRKKTSLKSSSSSIFIFVSRIAEKYSTFIHSFIHVFSAEQSKIAKVKSIIV